MLCIMILVALLQCLYKGFCSQPFWSPRLWKKQFILLFLTPWPKLKVCCPLVGFHTTSSYCRQNQMVELKQRPHITKTDRFLGSFRWNFTLYALSFANLPVRPIVSHSTSFWFPSKRDILFTAKQRNSLLGAFIWRVLTDYNFQLALTKAYRASGSRQNT